MLTRYLLDNKIIVESPDGWQKRITRIKHDRKLKGRLVTEDATLEWFSDGYQYIKQIHDQSICNEIEVLVQVDELETGAWQTEFKGKIKMPDCEFEISPNSVRTPLVDDGYYSRIANNQSIKSTVNNARSKNDVQITPAFERELVCFDPADGTYGYGGRTAYSIHECFRYMIDFMSDGEIGYISETFDDVTPGPYAKYLIILGIELKLGATNTDEFLELTFSELYQEIDKQFNIGFRMEYINNKPTMRIERASWFYKSNTHVKFDFIRSIKRKVDSENLFSGIGLGSSTTDDTPSLAFPENARWFGFKDEQFYLLGQCNIDKVLDLKNNWIISSNVIQDVVVTGADAYDDDIFIIEVTDLLYNTAQQSNWFTNTPPPYYYNEHLTNEHKTARWLDGIPQSVVAQLGIANNRFKAVRNFNGPLVNATSPNPGGSAYNSTVEPFQFNDDFTAPLYFDPSNSYGNGTVQGSTVSAANSRFTAAGAGVFTFDCYLPFRIDHADNNFNFYFTIELKRYSSANVLISTQTQAQSFGHPPPGFYSLNLHSSINMNATDYVVIRRHIHAFTNVWFAGSYIQFQELAGGTFSCEFASIDEGGQYSIVDTNNQRFMKYSSAGVPCSREVSTQMILDTTQPVYLNTDGNNNFKGWIDDIAIYRETGKANIALLGRRIDEPLIK